LFELEFDPQVDELDATTGADGGFGDVDTGVIQGMVRARLYVDVSASVYLSIVAATTITNVNLYLDLTSPTSLCTLPIIKVLSTPIRARVRDSWQIDFMAKTRGTFTVNI
jgi:hypothetical protein